MLQYDLGASSKSVIFQLSAGFSRLSTDSSSPRLILHQSQKAVLEITKGKYFFHLNL